ncbi:DUF3179 domain-containing protein [Halomicroarcula sp. GCM10025743]|uniref:DUF3179 domain-containing protein n=1 Tax=Halomicroarcula sp. GCM10025743 TaxID=3252671 RepID=UPI0036074A6C
MDTKRRTFLRALGAAGVAGLAGCTGTGGSGGPAATETEGGGTATTSAGEATTISADDARPPTVDRRLFLGHDVETIRSEITSGGVPKDGIPAIDDPQFGPAEEAALDPGDPVFGAVRDGEAKAYPQSILVWHEIVNDVLGGDPVAVTYCPLTGTAQGFERGPVEFGTSGDLVNSNLVMYDRGTDSRWPQVTGTAVEGPLVGQSLREFRVVWTTWEHWRAVYPDTVVLTDETGFSRRYGSDPYGQYNPERGYYANDRTIFSPLVSDDRNRPKDVVIGTRTTEGALSFDKKSLLDERVLGGAIGETEYVAVADPALETGYVYETSDGLTVAAAGDGYRVDGETYAAAELPLDRTLAFDGMWFAWAGFYPELPYVE